MLVARPLLLASLPALALGLAAAPAIAADVPAAASADAGAAPPAAPADYHAPTAADIIVTAPFRRERGDVLSGISVVQGAKLTQALRPTIGETLARTPGVSATSFGPSASRPVLRGLQGERVRVLTDGIGSIDVSSTSADHATVINPLLAERVEVLRGPESLLYGSSAIGGVVNVIDRRIPRTVPDEPIHVDAIAGYGSAANERSVGGAINAPIGQQFVVHADGSYLKTGDLRTGGAILAPGPRAEALASSRLPAAEQVDADGEPLDFAGAAALRGTLPNSASRTWTAGVGAALITATGNIGVSYSRYDSVYGIPVRYATTPGAEQEAPRLDLKQDRFDARAEIDTGGEILSAIRARFGTASYRHYELEEDGSIGTAFYNQGLEGRLEVAQAKRGGWQGASGVQYYARDFDVIGEEGFLPRNSTEQLGLFTLQQLDLGAFKLAGGLRYEETSLKGKPRPGQPQFYDGSRRFDAISGSAGASYAIAPEWRIGVNLSRSTRAPSAEELFANGPHGGTESYELGDPLLTKERAWGLEATLRGRGTGYSIEASVYANRFRNFIYQDQVAQAVCEARAPGGDVDLPCYATFQADARYWGVELQGDLTLARFGDATLAVDGLADYVHATIEDVGPAPRTPPLRVLGGVSLGNPLLDGRLEVEHSWKQDRLSTFETETAAFTLVNAELNVRPWGTERPLSFALSANNIFDVVARRHASILKDYAPLAGRDFRITAKASF